MTNAPAEDAKPIREKVLRREGGVPRFALIPFDKLQPSTDPDYLIKGLFPRVGLVVVWGLPKCGKSFWVTDAMLHVALGWEYRGHRVTQGSVVYCAFEGQEGYGKRAEAFRRRYLTDATDPAPFYLVAARMSLVRDHPELIRAIRCQSVQPIAVVLDTLNRSLDGSENDDRDMTAYIRAADAIREAFGCVMIIVHHCGVQGTRPRGHTSLTGAVDAQLAVKRDTAANVLVEIEWMKDGAEGEIIVSRLEVVEVGTDDDGEPITSCVVVPTDTPAADPGKARRLPKSAQTALRALQEAIDKCGAVPPASNHIPPNCRTTSLDRWRQYAYSRGISAGEGRARQMAFKRAADTLVAEQLVGVWNGHAWVTA
jgi:hypothetical protein